MNTLFLLSEVKPFNKFIISAEGGLSLFKKAELWYAEGNVPSKSRNNNLLFDFS